MERGVDTKGIESVSEQKVIDVYLRKVEKNLKGFTQDAKDSIVSEIEDHIREKIGEAAKAKDKIGPEDRQGDVSGILRELGSAEKLLVTAGQ